MKKSVFVLVFLLLLSVTGHRSASSRGDTSDIALYSYGEGSAEAYVRDLDQPAVADLDPSKVEINFVTGGLVQPIFITHAGDGSGRLFIVERAGLIRLYKDGGLYGTPFLNMQSIVNSASGEQGLLALAFHPQYATNGFFYTVHTDSQNSLVLSRFVVSPPNSDLADLSSRSELLVIPHPTYANHNGGTLLFGPDGYLYWSTGDGGGGGDPGNNAQNLNSLLGKILRLDVDTAPYGIPATNPFYDNPNPSIRQEIWAFGLRNPWRMSFDRLTGDLYIGDVGQGALEEIDFQPATSTGGENYGWRVMEGSSCYNPSSGCDQSGKVLPVAEYTHALGCSVTGGYVYRGSAYPDLQGHYFYADFCSGRIFDLRYSSGWVSSELLDTSYTISTFGEDENGELYFADYYQGNIYKIGYERATIFSDVPASYWAWSWIERLYNAGITAGCTLSPLNYCPNNTVTRGQMAVFLLRGIHDAAYIPPAVGGSTGFDDVPTTHQFAAWIKQLAAEGVTDGCGGGNYCPNSPVTRAQMAVFLLRAKYGSAYTPPDGTGTVFSDVTDPNWFFTDWIEQLYNEGITGGCGGGNYCPNNPVTRAQMAIFLVRTFNLP